MDLWTLYLGENERGPGLVTGVYGVYLVMVLRRAICETG